MSIIFVDTDNSDLENKIYVATMAGSAGPKAEAKMEAAIKKIMIKTPGFTVDKPEKPKGYTIRLKIAKIEKGGGNTKCMLSGSIVRYPKSSTAKRGEGEEMVSTSMTGNATATGTSDNSIWDCVEAIAEELATKSIQAMKIDWGKR